MNETNRRQDSALRHEIDKLRKVMHGTPSCHTLYQALLESICNLNASPLGFVAELQAPIASEPPKWHIVSLHQHDAPRRDQKLPHLSLTHKSSNNVNLANNSLANNNTPNRNSGEDLHTVTPIQQAFQHLPSNPKKSVKLPHLIPTSKPLDRIARSQATEVLNHDNVRQLNDLFESKIGWPKLTQMILLPLIEKTKVFAIIGIANGETPYHSNIARRAWPLLTTATCLYRMMFKLDTTSQKNLCPSLSFETHQDDWYSIFASMEFNAPIGLVEINTNHKITRFNPAAEKIFDTPSEEATGQALSKFIPERYPNEHKIHSFSKLSNKLPNQPSPNTKQYSARTRQGSMIPIEIEAIQYNRHHQTHFMLMITDSSELKTIQEKQEAEVQRFRAVADLAPVGILQTNAHWEAIYVNDRWCEICQREADEVNEMGWISVIHHEDVSDTLSELRTSVIEGREYKTQCRLQTPLGDIVWVELMARPLYSSMGMITGFLATLIDCTYRHQTEEKLRCMAERDALTGLANRALFQDRLQQALARVQRKGTLILFGLDLDGFKNVNDTLGHDAGDDLLVQVSQRLTACVRRSDTVSRVGGDEFMVLVEGMANATVAAEIAEKILEHLASPFFIAQQEVFISTSIGITFSVSSRDMVDSKALLKQADIALYRAKAMGRNNYQYFSPELEAASKDRMFLGNSLHRALERAEFRVYYQLQADLKTETITGTEALLRWQHPDRGLLPPSEFINLLEETGIIVQVSRWLWDVALRQHKSWLEERALDQDSHISINFSPRQLRDPLVVHHFEEALEKSGLEGKHVVAEITESVLLENSQGTLDTLHGLRGLGVRIALDDFGTGYSSLSYLKRFPIDIIKIDQSFIRDLLTDPEDAAITQAIITLAHTLELTVVAEGVDDPKKREQLNTWNCDNYQGYQLNQPTPDQETRQIIFQNRTGSLVEVGK